ncbi:hypothetical protein [Streptomyces sp. 769]|uniref:hypothetical protein n=1 Tax=Streptomyces sp. 769 TaxID=1262452 RepID=UPI00057ED461|nr:hypothetical protein [Streptomyces sp. 769]AJC58624.1 hypothetical protein GZL_06051 [Streptomyces sp. 769]
MTEEQPLIPRTQPPPRRAGRFRKPPRSNGAETSKRDEQHRLEQPLNHIAPHLEPPWAKEDTDTPERTTNYTRPEGHHIGLRLQPGELIIQTWITAGPDLPPIPAGTAEEKADTKAANDARLRPGRSWHATVTTRHPQHTRGLLDAVVRNQLIPALTNKPKRVPTPTVRPEPEPEPEKTASANPRRATTEKETEK